MATGAPAMNTEKHAPQAEQLCFMPCSVSEEEPVWSAAIIPMSWQGISALGSDVAPCAESNCICVLMAQAEPAEMGSHSIRKRQMIFLMA